MSKALSEEEKTAWGIQHFSNLRKLIKKGQHTKVLDECNKMLVILPNDEDIIKSKVVCLINLSKFAAALELAIKHDYLKFERAYCYYRLNELEKTIEICKSFANPKPEKVLHMESQALYKLEKYNESIASYRKLVDGQRDPNIEHICNLYAAFTASGKGMEALEEYPITDSKKLENNYELHYNRACANLSGEGVEEAKEDLALAREVCHRVLTEEGCDEAEIQRESAAIVLQESYLNIISGHMEGCLDACKDVLKIYSQSKDKDLELIAVAANNLAVLRGDRDLPDSLRRLRTTITTEAEGKLAPSQLRELRFNRCILLLHLRKIDEALRTLDELEIKYGKTVFVRAALIRASAFACHGKWSEAEAAIASGLNFQSDEVDEVIGGNGGAFNQRSVKEQLQLLSVQIFIAKGMYREASTILRDNVPSLAMEPAHVSALYALDVLSGDTTTALQQLYSTAQNILSTLSSSSSSSSTNESTTQARYKLILQQSIKVFKSEGNLAQAIVLLQGLMGSGLLDAEERLEVVVELVVLLSYTDKAAAEKYSDNLPQLNLAVDLTPEALEKLEIPRTSRSSSSGSRLASSLTAGKKASKKNNSANDTDPIVAGDGQKLNDANNNSSNKKNAAAPNREKLLRKRLKFKNLYLLKLQTAGKYDPTRPVKPDPERWLPRKQRSYAKRGRKNRQKFVGGQGSGDGAQKDMAKLDAYARAAAKKEEEARAAEEAAKKIAGGSPTRVVSKKKR